MVHLNTPEVLRNNNPSLVRIVVVVSPPSGKVTAVEEGEGFLDISLPQSKAPVGWSELPFCIE